MLRLIILLSFFSKTSIASEPQCSRFHYEEKTLEKMIKLEFFVQKIKDDIDAIEKRVTDFLHEIENKSENLKLDWENEREVAQEKLVEMKEISKADIRKAEDEMKKITESIINTNIDAIKKRVTDTLRETENKTENLKLDWELERDAGKKDLVEMKEMATEQIRKAEDIMNNIKESTITMQAVAFVAKMSSGSSMTVSAVLLYGDIIMNEGNGYDSATGVFIAPVTGTYLFTLQFCATPADGVGYAVMSKNKEIKRGYLKDDDKVTCSSADAIDVLNKGDSVWVKCIDPTVVPQGVNYWNTFSGVLLHN